ncbi:Crp/Fnr family transcriptional regulator [Mucilaginibacter sp. X5P1]|uniref:Crp/Fnr family transcriptional regulator n=1 Tax=Mucilaginibacter sp. X5P1 TaxID=2723088 RepID=UPI00160D74DD|nr:Crp/Fnr family transcriptional regulator [Mucilaginibacter sp. X5P1]MBB6140897.1 CRP-like cAMP-binding protein [Mucilaginibacter sp. X5P1]
MLNFKAYLKTLFDFTDEEFNFFSSRLKVKEYKKGDIIYRDGDINHYSMFINKGLVRSYFLTSGGKEYTWYIHFFHKNASIKNLFVVDYPSFIFSLPGKLFFEVLEDAQLFAIDIKGLTESIEQNNNWQLFGRLISNLAYKHTYNRTLSLLTETAAERYQRLLNETPELFDLVPHYYIASFLSITPQSLSRLRKNAQRNST